MSKLTGEEKKAVLMKGLREFFTWDYHYERGTMLGLVAAFIYFTLKAEPDANLSTVYYQGVTPYGVLWTWMNPLYWTNLPYTLALAAEVGLVFGAYLWLIKKGKLNKIIVYLDFFIIDWLCAFHAQQNITTIMLVPLITISPLILIPMLFERIPLGWSFPDITNNIHWWCAFGGNGNGYDNQINPCLTVGTKLNFMHVYSMAYWITVIWTAVVLLYWYRHRRQGKWYGLTQYIMDIHDDDFQSAFIGTRMKEWFCSLCGEWKDCAWFERGDIEKDGWVEFGFNMKNGFWFEGEWFCWNCVNGKNCDECWQSDDNCGCFVANPDYSPGTKSEDIVARGEDGVVREFKDSGGPLGDSN